MDETLLISNELREVSMVVTIIYDVTEWVVAEQRKDEIILAVGDLRVV